MRGDDSVGIGPADGQRGLGKMRSPFAQVFTACTQIDRQLNAKLRDGEITHDIIRQPKLL